MIDVHYTWIGPPRLDERDVGQPTAMMRSIRSDLGAEVPLIHYWCLDRHVHTYRSYFKAHNFRVRNREKLEVRGIERYLDGRVGIRRGKRDVALMQAITWFRSKVSWDIDMTVRAIVLAAARNSATVREIVNAKNAWSLYALHRLGGYVMDAGVGPLQGRADLRAYREFKAPAEGGPEQGGLAGTHVRIGHRYLRDRCSLLNMSLLSFFQRDDVADLALPHIDVWTLYAPQGDATALRALEWYARFWFILEEYRQSSRFDEEYYKDLCRNGVVLAVLNGLAHGARCQEVPAANLWTDAVLQGQNAGIPRLGLTKRYFGSHR